MDVGWYFNVRNDVLTGCYPLPFHVTYYQSGALVETDITTYINIKGSDPKKKLIKDEDDEEKKAANPRIIVTGYRTDPEEVYAGSTFNLTVSVKNTSRQTAVENVLFNMEATVEERMRMPPMRLFCRHQAPVRSTRRGSRQGKHTT